jgi:hypothetical protein
MLKGMWSVVERAQKSPAWRRTRRLRPQRGLRTAQSKPQWGKYHQNGCQALHNAGISEVARFSFKYKDYLAPFVHTMNHIHASEVALPVSWEPNQYSNQAVGLTTEESGLYSQSAYETVILSTTSRQALWPTQSPIQWVPGPDSLGVWRPGREADDSLLSGGKVKNAWSYTSIFPYMLMAWWLRTGRIFRNTGFLDVFHRLVF